MGVELQIISIQQPQDMPDLQLQIEQDPVLRGIKQSLLLGEPTIPGYSWDHGRLLFKCRVVVASGSPTVKTLLEEYHNSPAGGHAGALKTFHRLAIGWYWKGMKKDVVNYVSQCEICQRNKSQALSPAGLLQPLPVPNQVWEDVAMDFVEGLPISEGYDTILVVVDRLSKYAHFVALRHPFSAQGVAEVFMREVVRLHGIPRSVVSDRDKVFMSLF